MTPTPQPTAGDRPVPASATGSDATLEHAIARAVWTDIHWLMPLDRPVTIIVDGDDIRVSVGAAPFLPNPPRNA